MNLTEEETCSASNGSIDEEKEEGNVAPNIWMGRMKRRMRSQIHSQSWKMDMIHLVLQVIKGKKRSMR